MQRFCPSLSYSRTLRQLGSIVCAALFLAACSSSGGDSGGGATPAATPTTGRFVDSPVNGLHYASPPSNPAGGFTTNGGQYQCMSGDTVTFDLGGRTIGTGHPCGPLVTVVSVFGATSTADTRVRNLSQLLLTLGGVPNGQNPIQLPATIPADLPTPLDFSDPNFTTVLQTALPGTPVVTEAQADAHLQTSFKTLSVTAVNSGMVTSNPAGIACTAGDCSYAFVTGTAVTLTATGTGFTGWSGDGCSGTGTCQIMLEAIKGVRALFLAAPPPATLTILPNQGTGAGTISCSTNGGAFGPCAASYPSGTVLVLRATANNVSTFSGWIDGTSNATGCNNTAADCSITLTANSEVRGNFTSSVTLVSVTANTATSNGGGGSVSCNANGGAAGPCGSYPVGAAMVLTAAPNSVSNFTGWNGGSGNAAACNGNTGTCNFTVTTNTTITANFNRPTLTVTVAGTGTVNSNPAGITNCTTNCSAAFNKNSFVTLTASGTGFSGWSLAGCPGTGTCQVTLTTDITVTANFGGTASSSPFFLFVRDPNGGPLLVIDPATPAAPPNNPVVATQQGAASMITAAYAPATFLATTFKTPNLVYISGGKLWKVVRDKRINSAVPGSSGNPPVQISNESAATIVCLGRLTTENEITDINKSLIIYELPGNDNDCLNQSDNVTKMAKFGDSSSTAPTAFAPGMVASFGGNQAFNLTTGSLTVFFLVDTANSNRLIKVDVATGTPIQVQPPTTVVGSSVRILAQDTSDRLFLKTDTTVYLYTISSNTLTELVSATGGSSLLEGNEFSADSTHLYVVDATPGVVKKIPLTATGSGNVINHFTAPASVLQMALSENRLVLKVSANRCTPITLQASEGLLSVRKDNNAIVTNLIPTASGTCVTGTIRTRGLNVFYGKTVSGTTTAGVISEDGTTVVPPISGGQWAGNAGLISLNLRTIQALSAKIFLTASSTPGTGNGATVSVYDMATPTNPPLVAGTIPSTTNPVGPVQFFGNTTAALATGFAQATFSTEVFFLDDAISNSLVRVPTPSANLWFQVQ